MGAFSFMTHTIKVGDYVYLEAFDLFALVMHITPRYTWKKPANKKAPATDFPFNTRTMYPATDLVYVNPLVSLTKYGASRSYDVAHCQKVTKQFLNTYKGMEIAKLLAKLECVKPDE